MTSLVLILSLLAAPVSALAGVAAGAVLTYRAMKGMPPIPPLRFRPRQQEPEEEKKEKRTLPKLGA